MRTCLLVAAMAATLSLSPLTSATAQTIEVGRPVTVLPHPIPTELENLMYDEANARRAIEINIAIWDHYEGRVSCRNGMLSVLFRGVSADYSHGVFPQNSGNGWALTVYITDNTGLPLLGMTQRVNKAPARMESGEHKRIAETFCSELVDLGVHDGMVVETAELQGNLAVMTE